MLALLTGIFAGFLHVLAGPDHLAAVAPLAADGRRRWQTGAIWGAGHTSGVWIVGIAALFLRDALPIDQLSQYAERLVGVTLIAIGIWAFRKAHRSRLHTHVHTHDGHRHAHYHVHLADDHGHNHTAVGVGLLHGVAGSSHLFGVIPALGLPTANDTASYLIGFGLASILSMAGFTWLMGVLTERLTWLADPYRWVMNGAACLAVLVGCFWLTA